VALELYTDTYWFPSGLLAANVQAVVFPSNSNAPAALFADAAGTIPIANPLPTDGVGVLTFYAAAGDYWIHIDTETFAVTLPTPGPGPFLPLSGGTVTGQLNLVSGNFIGNVAKSLAAGLSTGLLSGAQMTGVGTSTVTFAAGIGVIVDWSSSPTDPSVQYVTIPATVHPLAGVELTRIVNWWMVDAAGVITSQASRPTDAERRTKIQLGVTASVIGPGTLFNVQTTPVVDQQPAEQFADLVYGLGPFSKSGNQVSANGANLMIDKSAGELFAASFGYQVTPDSPNHVVSPAESPMTFRYSTRLAGSQGPLTTAFDPANYDVAGVITPVPGGANTSTIQRVYLFGTGVATAQLALQYGQSFYASLAAALDNIGAGTFVENPDYLGIAVLVGYIVSVKSATALNNPAQAVFVRAGKFAVS
jgi:hypothetical protein